MVPEHLFSLLSRAAACIKYEMPISLLDMETSETEFNDKKQDLIIQIL